MKIAQVAPLTEAVPPKLYGGTERVVAYLTDALVELGHDVTLFASGDSVTKATLVARLAARAAARSRVTGSLRAPVHAARDGGAAGARIRCDPLPPGLFRLSICCAGSALRP